MGHRKVWEKTIRRQYSAWVLGGAACTDNGLHLINNFARLAVTNGSGSPKQREYSVVDDLSIHPSGIGTMGF